MNSYTGVFIKPGTVTRLRTLANLGTDLWLVARHAVAAESVFYLPIPFFYYLAKFRN